MKLETFNRWFGLLSSSLCAAVGSILCATAVFTTCWFKVSANAHGYDSASKCTGQIFPYHSNDERTWFYVVTWFMYISLPLYVLSSILYVAYNTQFYYFSLPHKAFLAVVGGLFSIVAALELSAFIIMTVKVSDSGVSASATIGDSVWCVLISALFAVALGPVMAVWFFFKVY